MTVSLHSTLPLYATETHRSLTIENPAHVLGFQQRSSAIDRKETKVPIGLIPYDIISLYEG